MLFPRYPFGFFHEEGSESLVEVSFSVELEIQLNILWESGREEGTLGGVKREEREVHRTME
jgi:hypothetical protein